MTINILHHNVHKSKCKNNGGRAMINFNNKKTQRKIAGVIAGLLVFAMVVGLLVTSLS
jgi:hypothetical protein